MKASSMVRQPFSRTLSKTSPPEHNLKIGVNWFATQLSCRDFRDPRMFRRVLRCLCGPLNNKLKRKYH